MRILVELFRDAWDGPIFTSGILAVPKVYTMNPLFSPPSTKDAAGAGAHGREEEEEVLPSLSIDPHPCRSGSNLERRTGEARASSPGYRPANRFSAS